MTAARGGHDFFDFESRSGRVDPTVTADLSGFSLSVLRSSAHTACFFAPDELGPWISTTLGQPVQMGDNLGIEPHAWIRSRVPLRVGPRASSSLCQAVIEQVSLPLPDSPLRALTNPSGPKVGAAGPTDEEIPDLVDVDLLVRIKPPAAPPEAEVVAHPSKPEEPDQLAVVNLPTAQPTPTAASSRLAEGSTVSLTPVGASAGNAPSMFKLIVDSGLCLSNVSIEVPSVHSRLLRGFSDAADDAVLSEWDDPDALCGSELVD